MYYNFICKEKKMRIIANPSAIPVHYFVKNLFVPIINEKKEELLDDFLNYLCDQSNRSEYKIYWNDKNLKPISLNKDIIKNPRIEKGYLKFELPSSSYSTLKSINPDQLKYYDLRPDSIETFRIDLTNIALNMFTKNKDSIKISYFPNTFLTEGVRKEHYKYSQIELNLFGKPYKLTSYVNSDYNDEETALLSIATSLISRSTNNDKFHCQLDEKNYNFPCQKTITADDRLHYENVGIFKYSVDESYNDNPNIKKYYVMIPSKHLKDDGKGFSINASLEVSYPLLDTDFNPANKNISGIELLNYIRHTISKNYKYYECVGVSEKDIHAVGFPRSLDIIRNLSELSDRNTYLIPAPVYSYGDNASDEKAHDNSDFLYPDSLENINNAFTPEGITKYHHNRGLFYIEAALDINQYKICFRDYNRTLPNIKLTKGNQLQLHFGKKDFITKAGKRIPYVKKLPFSLGNINDAKKHAIKANKNRKEKYQSKGILEQYSPWEFESFDKVKSENDYTVESWQDTFMNNREYYEWIEEFKIETDLTKKEDMYLIPLPKEDSKNSEGIIENALTSIKNNYAWYCPVSTLNESTLDTLNNDVCAVLQKSLGYDEFSVDASNEYILGTTNVGKHSIDTPILKIVSKEELESLRKTLYSKWIENNIERKL